MANVSGPYGFLQVGTASGPDNFASAGSPKPYKIVANSAQSFFNGDAVRLVVSGDTDYSASATGAYIIPWANGDGAGSATKILVGIFVGCEYYSTSQKKTIYNNYFPGTDSASDAVAYVVDDPMSLWQVQCGTTNAIGVNVGMAVDVGSSGIIAGNTTTGQSKMFLSNTFTTTATLPFKIVNQVTSPPGANGTDQTTAYNNVIVAFNNQQYKALLGV